MFWVPSMHQVDDSDGVNHEKINDEKQFSDSLVGDQKLLLR